MSEATETSASIAQRNAVAGTGPKVGGPPMKQPTFDWTAKDKHTELKNIEMEKNQNFHD